MMQRQAFIDSISAEMVTACNGTKLFPSVMLAQACLESNNGNSLLSSKYFNFFGMKPGSSWTGRIISMHTNEEVKGKMVSVWQPFRVYKSFEESALDHIALLQRVSVYKAAGLFECKTPEEQAAALLKAGYATDSHYPQKLIAIMEECELKQYDV